MRAFILAQCKTPEALSEHEHLAYGPDTIQGWGNFEDVRLFARAVGIGVCLHVEDHRRNEVRRCQTRIYGLLPEEEPVVPVIHLMATTYEDGGGHFEWIEPAITIISTSTTYTQRYGGSLKTIIATDKVKEIQPMTPSAPPADTVSQADDAADCDAPFQDAICARGTDASSLKSTSSPLVSNEPTTDADVHSLSSKTDATQDQGADVLEEAVIVAPTDQQSTSADSEHKKSRLSAFRKSVRNVFSKNPDLTTVVSCDATFTLDVSTVNHTNEHSGFHRLRKKMVVNKKTESPKLVVTDHSRTIQKIETVNTFNREPIKEMKDDVLEQNLSLVRSAGLRVDVDTKHVQKRKLLFFIR